LGRLQQKSRARLAWKIRSAGRTPSTTALNIACFIDEFRVFDLNAIVLTGVKCPVQPNNRKVSRPLRLRGFLPSGLAESPVSTSNSIKDPCS
jgi:hypothetical protein